MAATPEQVDTQGVEYAGRPNPVRTRPKTLIDDKLENPGVLNATRGLADSLGGWEGR